MRCCVLESRNAAAPKACSCGFSGPVSLCLRFVQCNARATPVLVARQSFVACRSFSPALSLSLLSPKLSWSEDETKAGVQRGFTVTHPDGTGFTAYDLKRLQARRTCLSSQRSLCGPCTAAACSCTTSESGLCLMFCW